MRFLEAPREILGGPSEGLGSTRRPYPSPKPAESSRNQAKSKQNRIQIKPKASRIKIKIQIQIRIPIKSKSNQNQILGNPGKNPNTILGNPNTTIGNPMKNQEILKNSSEILVGPSPRCRSARGGSRAWEQSLGARWPPLSLAQWPPLSGGLGARNYEGSPRTS